MPVLTTDARRHLVLANGIELVGVHLPRSPLAALRLRLRVGSADEAPAEHGLAHVLEHLVVRCSMGGGRVGDRALIEATTGRQHTGYEVVVRGEDAGTAASVLGAALRPLRPDARVLDDELAAIRRERAQRTSDVRWRVQEAMFAALWPGTPYAHPVLGDPATVDGLTPEAVHRFHSHWYRPSHATLTVASARVDEDLSALAEQAQRWAPEDPQKPGDPHPGDPHPGDPNPSDPHPGDPPADRPRAQGVTVPPTGHAVASESLAAGRRAVGIAFSGPRGASAACLALARRAVRAAAGIDVQQLGLGGHLATWVMLSAADEAGAARSLAAALRAAQGRMLGPDGPALLHTEALIPELRTAEDVGRSVADDPGRVPAAEWAAVTAGDVAAAVDAWQRSFAAATPDEDLR